MGFFDKVKNMFTEEVEDDDVKVEQIKQEVTHVSIESPSVKKEEYEEENTKEFKFEKEESVNKPVFFDDNDFRDLNFSTPKVEEKKPIEKEKTKEIKDVYGSRMQPERKEIAEKKSFKPTPIISPVYGILDKNYHKEDIVSKTEQPVKTVAPTSDNEVSIESIRNKAYGTLEDELENTLFGSNSILFKKDEEENVEINEISDDALTNLTDDISKELDELLIKKEKYLDDDVESYEEDSSLNDDDLLGFIDSTLYKNGDEE